MPEANVFPFDANAVNARGGEGVVRLVTDKVIPAMKKQFRNYGRCTLTVFEGVDRTPKKKGRNKREDDKISSAVKRFCNVMQEAVDPGRSFDGNLENLCSFDLYNIVEIRNGIDPNEEDVHSYEVIWSQEMGCLLKRRLLKELEEGTDGTVFRAWKIITKPIEQEKAKEN